MFDSDQIEEEEEKEKEGIGSTSAYEKPKVHLNWIFPKALGTTHIKITPKNSLNTKIET